MKLNRTAASILAAPVLLLGTVLWPSAAQAAPEPLLAADASAATSLSDSLGARSAGTFIDTESGRMVVAVTTAAAAKQVRQAGAIAKTVKYSTAQLDSVQATMSKTVDVPGTARHTDVTTNQVVVTVDSTVTGARLAAVKSAVAAAGDAARLETTAEKFQLFIAGGQAIYTGGSRCSLGFNVRRSSALYFVTAGHCTNAGSSWSNGSVTLGTRDGSSFPGNDFGIVRYTNTSIARPSAVYLYSGSSTQAITSVGSAAVNQNVQRSGSTTGVRSGRVTATNATVTYREGTVSGLIRTTVCAQPGDSGGPLYAGNTGLGLTSGGSGNCTTGGTTYFQPLNEVMSVYGLSLG